MNVGTRLALRDLPFSIASGPHDRELQLLIKARDDFSSHVLAIPHGTPATVDGPHGRGEITTEAMGAALGAADRNRCLCFVCGPPSMKVAVERELLALGVPECMVVYERFEYD